MAIQSFDLSYACAELSLALRVIHRCIHSVPKDELDDLKELFAEFAEASAAGDEERCDSARKAIEELIVGVPTGMAVMAVPAGTGELERWNEFIGARIRKLRGESGMTQEQLAEKTGIAQSYISRLEKAQHSPNALTLEKIAKAFGVPVTEFDLNPPERTAN